MALVLGFLLIQWFAQRIESFIPLLINLAAHSSLEGSSLASQDWRVTTVIVFSVAVFFYSTILPLPLYVFHRFPILSKFVSLPKISFASEYYPLLVLFGLYLVFPAAYVGNLHNFPRIHGSVRAVAMSWAAIPCLLVGLIIGSAMLVPVFAWRRRKRWTREYLALLLLRLIDRKELGSVEAELGDKAKANILEKMAACADGIGKLYPKSDAPASHWASEQLALAALNFLALSTWLYFPQAGTTASLRRILCNYANIFISGNLHELPRKPISEIQGLSIQSGRLTGKRRALVFVGVLTYLGLPPLLYACVSLLFKVALPSSAGPPIALLYLVWVVCGLVIVAEKVSPDTRNLFADVIKAIVGRK